MTKWHLAVGGMRGQRLFVRAIDSTDHEAIRAFLSRHGRSKVPASGLLGKLLGELVAVLEMQITPDAVLINDIVVERELRRKRIGRVMLDELEQIAAGIERHRLVIDDSTNAAAFLQRVGFKGRARIGFETFDNENIRSGLPARDGCCLRSVDGRRDRSPTFSHICSRSRP